VTRNFNGEHKPLGATLNPDHRVPDATCSPSSAANMSNDLITIDAALNRHSPDSRPVGRDHPTLEVPPQRNSIAADPLAAKW
jgi:hypothetical protein